MNVGQCHAGYYTTKLLGGGGGYIGFTPSVRPSVPHPVSALKHLQFLLDTIFGNVLKLVTLTLSSVDLESDVNH